MKTFKLKYLKAFSKGDIDYALIMKHYLGYKAKWFLKIITFKYFFKKAYFFVEDLKKIDISKIEYESNNPIKLPNSVDDVSYLAMMELNSIMESDLDPIDVIIEVVSRICYKAYYKDNYKSDSKNFIKFKSFIENQDYKHALGVYNKLIKDLKQSSDYWKTKFVEVEVLDEDYTKADSGIMNQFNVIETLKSICTDFNYNLDQAWQVPYGIVQTNSLSKASRNFVQDNLRKIKELKMRSARQS